MILRTSQRLVTLGILWVVLMSVALVMPAATHAQTEPTFICEEGAPTFLTAGGLAHVVSTYDLPETDDLVDEEMSALLPAAWTLNEEPVLGAEGDAPLTPGTVVAVMEETACDIYNDSAVVTLRQVEVVATGEVGWLPESYHWETTLPTSAADLASLSLYTLEPLELTPDTVPVEAFAAPDDAVIYCDGAAPSFVSVGDSALYAASIGYDGDALEEADAQTELGETQRMMRSMGLFAGPVVWDGGAWAGEAITPVLTPGTAIETVISGPECIYTYRVAEGEPSRRSVALWWYVLVTDEMGLTQGGWLPENRSDALDPTGESFVYQYFMQPGDFDGATDQQITPGSSAPEQIPYTGAFTSRTFGQALDVIPPDAVDPCADQIPSRLAVGRLAQPVSPPLVVRASPNGEPSDRILEGGEMLVLSGPACIDGSRWWQVDPFTGLVDSGWVLENDSEVYYSVPVEGES